MKNRPGDILATVKFLPTDTGGRKGPTPDNELRPILTIDNESWSVCLHLEGIGSIHPGQTVKVPISFYFLQEAKHHLMLGKQFTLKEINKIADGVIEEILFL